MEENHVYLLIEPHSGTHQEVSALLQLQPSKAWNAGDKKPPPSPAHYTTTKWLLQSSAPLGSTLEQHTEALLAVLEPISAKVAEAAAVSHARFFYAAYCQDTHLGYIFSPGIVCRIAALGLGIELDLYPSQKSIRSA